MMINRARLAELLGYLYDMKGLQCSIHEPDGREIFTASARSAYCDLIAATPGGYERCLHCDRNAIRTAIDQKTPFEYRCHAGAIDAAIPVLVGGQTQLIILFGQILDDSPVDEQWEHAQKLMGWYPDLKALKQAFYRLPRYSRREIRACYKMVNACVSETRLEQLSAPGHQQNAQKLELYIANHYMEPLTTPEVAQAMGLSVSRVCALASGIAPGTTVGKLLTQRRVNAAKDLLRDPQMTVREVAGRVGIPDYNYFTKVFKKVTGLTPTDWRVAEGNKGACQAEPSLKL